jgi:hypothetical protein
MGDVISAEFFDGADNNPDPFDAEQSVFNLTFQR